MRKEFIACAAVAFAFAVAPRLTVAQEQPGADLPEGKGKGLVVSVCSDCHGPETITAQRRSRADWDFVVQDMLSRGANASDDDAKTVVDYLARYLGRVNVNRATEQEIGDVLELPSAQAIAIVEYRMHEGDYKTLEDLKKVPRLDFTKLAGKTDRITFSGD